MIIKNSNARQYCNHYRSYYYTYVIYGNGTDTFNFNYVYINGQITVYGTNDISNISSIIDNEGIDISKDLQKTLEEHNITLNLLAQEQPKVSDIEQNFDTEQSYKYIFVRLNGWPTGTYNELTLKNTASYETLTTDEVITAQNIINRGGNHQGSKGNINYEAFGNFKNIDDDLKLFYPNAANGNEIGSLTRINALDASGDWGGYVQADVSASQAGKYTAYILGNTSDTNRSFKITNTTNNTFATTSTSNSTIYSTSNNLKIVKADIELSKGINKLKLQAANTAPNYIAMYITENPSVRVEPLNNGTAYNDGSMGWVATVSHTGSDYSIHNPKWTITAANSEAKTASTDLTATANDTTISGTGSVSFGLILTQNAIGAGNTITDVQFSFE